jgi:hypothetical protein
MAAAHQQQATLVKQRDAECRNSCSAGKLDPTDRQQLDGHIVVLLLKQELLRMNA